MAYGMRITLPGGGVIDLSGNDRLGRLEGTFAVLTEPDSIAWPGVTVDTHTIFFRHDDGSGFGSPPVFAITPDLISWELETDDLISMQTGTAFVYGFA